MQHTSESLTDLTKNLPPSIPRYTEYRKRFIELSQKAQLKVLTSAPQIQTDFSHSETQHETTLVSLTGVHGMEGYIGSDIQCQILQNLPANKSINIVFVHAVNAYGMARYRRANANNVDLNRNSVNHLEAKAWPSDFQRFLFLMESQSASEYQRNLIKALLKFFFLGRKRTIESVANGQFNYPKSLFFGGPEWQPELLNMFTQLKSLFPQTKKWVVLDIHSGFGKYKQESPIIDGDPSQEEIDFFQKTLQMDLIVPKKNPKYYSGKGSLRFGLVEKLPGTVFHLTQEFGTWNFIRLIQCLTLENAMFHRQRELDPAVIQEMVNCFYPNDPEWRKSCVHWGQDRWQRIHKQLSSETSFK